MPVLQFEKVDADFRIWKKLYRFFVKNLMMWGIDDVAKLGVRFVFT